MLTAEDFKYEYLDMKSRGWSETRISLEGFTTVFVDKNMVKHRGFKVFPTMYNHYTIISKGNPLSCPVIMLTPKEKDKFEEFYDEAQ
jgi:hypothetical protein